MILICSNTGNECADFVNEHLSIPVIHIADVTGKAILESNLTTVGLLGTKYTMEKDYIKKRLQERFNLDILIPDKGDAEIVNDVIYDELCMGDIKASSKEKYVTIINRLVKRGAEGIILGCTEIPLLVTQEDVEIPLFDTTAIHANAAVEYALK